MDRRQFAKLAVALFAGKATVEIAARHPLLLLEDARTNDFGPSQEFDATPWPARPVTQEMLDDCVVDVADAFEMDLALYGNAYMRRDGSRVPPLRAMQEMRYRHG